MQGVGASVHALPCAGVGICGERATEDASAVCLVGKVGCSNARGHTFVVAADDLLEGVAGAGGDTELGPVVLPVGAGGRAVGISEPVGDLQV